MSGSDPVTPQAGLPDSSASNSGADRLHRTPHVVLVTETPALQGAYPLVLHLAQLEAEISAPILVVDLAPAASRIVHTLGHHTSRLSHWRDKIQALWTDTAHGRSLNLWKRSGHVDLLAQLGSEFPETSQMPRICEQLVRQLATKRAQVEGEQPNYRQVFVMSECLGLSLDRSAWQAADEIWLLHDPKQAIEPVLANLRARLATRARQQQRVVVLNKVLPKLTGLAQGRRIEVVKHQRDSSVPALALQYEQFNLTWPMLSGRLALSLSRTARDISRHILHAGGTHTSRQAS